jgi:hypothetical protein
MPFLPFFAGNSFKIITSVPELKILSENFSAETDPFNRPQVRTTLFNVEGLKVEASDADTILLVLASLWLAMAKHLGLTSEDLAL